MAQFRHLVTLLAYLITCLESAALFMLFEQQITLIESNP